jgi:hypothetical protein
MTRKASQVLCFCIALFFVFGASLAFADMASPGPEANAEPGLDRQQAHRVDASGAGEDTASADQPDFNHARREAGSARRGREIMATNMDNRDRTRPSGSRPRKPLLFGGSTLAGWVNQSAAPNRVTVVRNPSGGKGTALKLTARNADVAPLTPTANPRAQLLSPNVVWANVPFWESYEVYLPKTFPLSGTYNNRQWNKNNFVGLGTPFYGPPWEGPASTGLGIYNGRFQWETNIHAPAGSRILWGARAVKQRWIKFTWHIVPAVRGFAELYVDYRPVRVTYNGISQDGVRIPVIDATDYQGPWISQLSVYYRHNQFSQLTVYFRKFRIARSKMVAEGG